MYWYVVHIFLVLVNHNYLLFWYVLLHTLDNVDVELCTLKYLHFHFACFFNFDSGEQIFYICVVLELADLAKVDSNKKI